MSDGKIDARSCDIATCIVDRFSWGISSPYCELTGNNVRIGRPEKQSIRAILTLWSIASDAISVADHWAIELINVLIQFQLVITIYVFNGFGDSYFAGGWSERALPQRRVRSEMLRLCELRLHQSQRRRPTHRRSTQSSSDRTLTVPSDWRVP